MPHYMYIKIATALNSQKKAVNGSSILFLGVAYKPNINDERESPALEIMDIVSHKGGNVSYHDPFIPNVKTNEGREFTSSDLSADLSQGAAAKGEALAKVDCVVLTTNHSDLDMSLIVKNANIIVDMRNMIEEGGEGIYKL